MEQIFEVSKFRYRATIIGVSCAYLMIVGLWLLTIYILIFRPEVKTNWFLILFLSLLVMSGYWMLESFANLRRAYQVVDFHLLIRENSEWGKVDMNNLHVTKADKTGIVFKIHQKKFTITRDFTGYSILLSKFETFLNK